MYNFVRCAPHPKCPDAQGWYLKVRPTDLDALVLLHKGVAALYFNKFGLDPHVAKSEFSGVCNPTKLAAQWMGTVSKELFSGKIILVNSKGGWLPLRGVKVLATRTSAAMRWPTQYANEVITVSRWPEGRHYYLSSNRDRIFSPSKFTLYEDALAEAGLYTEKVNSKGC